MPPRLDLSPAGSNKMFLSSPSPRMTLRRAASFNNNIEKAPLSSTSSRFSLTYLIAPPPPSPSLPALIPRHGKPISSPAPRKYIRLGFWLAGVFTILYFGYVHVKISHSVPTMGWLQHMDDREYEMVGEDTLPNHPTPLVASDRRGRAKWTVSIPPSYDFPLEPSVYAEICRGNTEVSNHVADLHDHKHKNHGNYGYYHVDPYFVDVAEAEEHGMLPSNHLRAANRGWESVVISGRVGSGGQLVGVGDDRNGLVTNDVCNRSMTFAMESGDAGMGNTLMMLWTAYGVAEKEGRAFFIDDSRWAYGNFTNYFSLPPVPNCRPPPRHQILPCPHHARHIVVSAATSPWAFGHAFEEEFGIARESKVHRQKPIYDLARRGYEALFHLKGSDGKYINDRLSTFSTRTASMTGKESDNGITIGVHVRHGDRHPLEFQYQDSYTPLEIYSDAAREILHDYFNSSGPNGMENMMAEMRSIMVVASDDPEVYKSTEFSHSSVAQELITLASKKGSPPAPRHDVPGTMFKRFVDESIGWEGGFYSAMFWTLGRSSAAPGAVVEAPNMRMAATAEALRLRELVGRAYLMDLAVLGGSDVVVCGVASMGCRILMVMMGWERGVEKGRWKNVDGGFEWRGLRWR